MMKHKWDLQLFAEGGGEGGAPAGQAEGGSAPAAPAVEEPALRPAEERQMRRSGQLKSRPPKRRKPPWRHSLHPKAHRPGKARRQAKSRGWR